MDPSANLPILPEHPCSAGELIVQNGKLSGTRCSLASLTMIGQAAACDLRLHEHGVGLMHCAIVRETAGLLLRDLDSPTGTRVNGKPVQNHHLVCGDVITIGSVQVTVHLEAPSTSEVPCADRILADHEREALRIQAAAVTAQQAALGEEEARLSQRGTALQRQEAQLASHLEEQQQHLEQQHAQIQQERAAFLSETASHRETMAREQAELIQKRSDLEQQAQLAERQRQRLSDLRKRMWRRYQRLGQDREGSLQRRESEVVATHKRLQQDREAFRLVQERVNGELELGRRQLQEEWHELGLAQQSWEQTINEEKTDQQRRLNELEQRATKIAAGEQAMQEQQQRWQQQQVQMQREAEGLEMRVRNQRAQLEQLQRETAARLPAPLPTGPVISVPPLAPALVKAPAENWPIPLEDLTGLLSDQRRHLAEQWQKVLEVQEHWQQERTAALTQLQASTERLAVREQEVHATEQRLRQAEIDNRQRQQRLADQRAALEGWQSRMVAEESAWQARQETLLDQIKERERLLEQRRQQLEDAQQRRNKRRKEEVAELLAMRDRCDEARREYVRLGQECEQFRVSLAEQERNLVAQVRALERFWQESSASAEDATRAASRLEKLARREISTLESETRAVRAEQARLVQERTRVDEEFKRVRQLEFEVITREQEWSQQVAEWERQRAGIEEEWQKRDQELRRLRSQHAISERQARQLREEIERLARVLIEEAITDPAQQAA